MLGKTLRGLSGDLGDGVEVLVDVYDGQLASSAVAATMMLGQRVHSGVPGRRAASALRLRDP